MVIQNILRYNNEYTKNQPKKKNHKKHVSDF